MTIEIHDMAEKIASIEAIREKALWNKRKAVREIEHLVRQIEKARDKLSQAQVSCNKEGRDISKDNLCIFYYKVIKGYKEKLLNHKVVRNVHNWN